MAQRLLIPILGGFIAALFLFGIFWTPNASASSHITCANVRCAGSCIDTPNGPTCTARLTCANTLCSVGNRCEERSSGPVCVPNQTISRPQVTPRPYVQPRPYVRPTPQPPGCRTYRDSYRGQGYYRRDCQRRPVYRPQPPRRPYYRRPGHAQPQPPVVPPRSRPDTQVCTAQYKPVCAQKAVQCFRAPCPAVKQTFGNACEASREGYSVLFNGVCGVR